MTQEQLSLLKRLFPNYHAYEVKGDNVKVWYQGEDPNTVITKVELGGFALKMRFDRTQCLVFTGRL
jgi:hypothetical protein